MTQMFHYKFFLHQAERGSEGTPHYLVMDHWMAVVSNRAVESGKGGVEDCFQGVCDENEKLAC